jgi:hypothetical protein
VEQKKIWPFAPSQESQTGKVGDGAAVQVIDSIDLKITPMVFSK